MKMPEEYRHTHPIVKFVSNDQDGGFFIIPHYDMRGYQFNVLANNGKEWEHVTVTVSLAGSRPTFLPTWNDMCFIKNLFWDEEETAMQLHPPKSEYVNNHPFALHLWGRKQKDIPLPASEMIGVKGFKSTLLI